MYAYMQSDVNLLQEAGTGVLEALHFLRTLYLPSETTDTSG